MTAGKPEARASDPSLAGTQQFDTVAFSSASIRNEMYRVRMSKRWLRAITTVCIACLTAAGCGQGQQATGTAPQSTDAVAPTRPVLPTAATRPPLSAVERDAVLKAWPAKREAAATLIGLNWSQGPVLKGFMRTKSSEWKGTSFYPAPPPKDSPLATIPLPEFYDVWVVRGTGTISCGAVNAPCSDKPKPRRWALIYGSDGVLYASLAWDTDTDAPPPDLSAVGVPAEEFDVA